MIKELVLGVVRHVLTVLGGGLVTQGYLDASELSTGVGAVLALIGIAWSIWDKTRTKKLTVELDPAAPERVVIKPVIDSRSVAKKAGLKR